MKNEVNKLYTTKQLILIDESELLKVPSLYQVVVHNDDFTPMEFVVDILERFFYMNRRKATDVMLEAHAKGRAVCGLFSKDFAESKVKQVVDYAKLHEHPLICSMEV